MDGPLSYTIYYHILYYHILYTIIYSICGGMTTSRCLQLEGIPCQHSERYSQCDVFADLDEMGQGEPYMCYYVTVLHVLLVLLYYCSTCTISITVLL